MTKVKKAEYRIKFQFGDFPYLIQVKAVDEEKAKALAKRKVRDTYGTERQYKFLEITKL